MSGANPPTSQPKGAFAPAPSSRRSPAIPPISARSRRTRPGSASFRTWRAGPGRTTSPTSCRRSSTGSAPEAMPAAAKLSPPATPGPLPGHVALVQRFSTSCFRPVKRLLTPFGAWVTAVCCVRGAEPMLSQRLPNRSLLISWAGQARPRRALALTLGALALASCAQPTGYYPLKTDAKPHANVARAHNLPVHGIDVSRWQGKIDWASVKSAGTKFAFIKATEGGDHTDPRCLENWHGAAQAGVPRGAYHFMYWCRPAHEQAAWFPHNVPNDSNALPRVLDLEWNGHSRTCPMKLPRETALAHVKLMLNEMEVHTRKRPIIYTDITFHRDVLEGELHDYPHWVRSVAAEPHERYVGRQWTM